MDKPTATKPTMENNRAGNNRGNKDANKEWIRVGKKKVVDAKAPSGTSADGPSIPSTNVRVPYEPTLPVTHNPFEMLCHEDIQEDLLAHAKLARTNKNLRDDITELNSAVTSSPLAIIHYILENLGEQQDGVTVSESEGSENCSNEEHTEDVEDFNNEMVNNRRNM